MLSLKIKDNKVREKFYRSENNKKIRKFLFINILNQENTNKERAACLLKNVSNKKISKVQINRRCVINNRGRSSVRPLGISRVHLRELLQFGLVPGYSKAVW